MSNLLYHAPCPNCGSRNNLGVYDDHQYCFGCGYTKFLNPLEKYKNKASGKVIAKPIWVPDDIEPYIPYEAQQWLNQYSLTPMEILKNRVVWSDTMKLLIFLYVKQGVLLAWQGRYFGNNTTKPKWWSQGNLKELSLILSSTSILGETNYGKSSLILVEDIISALKVSRQYDCMPLFGSFIDIPRLYSLAKGKYNAIYIWLDNDKYKEAHRYAYKLNNIGLKTYVLNTKQDPKELTNEQIRITYESTACYNSIVA